jgi:hypothetical protein
MRTFGLISGLLLIASVPTLGQDSKSDDFNLTLPDHNGHLSWSADRFKIIQTSAKANGEEIGLRGSDGAGGIGFLGFLFLLPQESPMTSVKCRDSMLSHERSSNGSLKIGETSETANPGSVPVALVDYSSKGNDGKMHYMARGFVATADICGDLEFYSEAPIHFADASLHRILASFKLDPNYVPQFKDVFLFAQILYDTQQFAAAGPLYEEALKKMKAKPPEDAKTMSRVLTDQAGMSYGISGNIAKARAIFEQAIATDPDYPMYYYNLACADAEENKLGDARKHLQQAFDRRANMIQGEPFPDPTKDDSFTPHRDDLAFWTFVEGLRSK